MSEFSNGLVIVISEFEFTGSQKIQRRKSVVRNLRLWKLSTLTYGTVMVLAALLASMWAPPAHAFPACLSAFSSAFPTSTSNVTQCQLCHVSSGGGSPWNAFGSAIKQAGIPNVCSSLSSALAIIQALDSDGEGNSNLTEINLGTQPGWCDPGNPICSNMAFNGDGNATGPATPPAGVPLDPAPANQAPMANPGGPYTGQVGVTIAFNGSLSSDPDGEPLTYAWNFGDGSTGTGVNPTHSYAASGTFTVSLIVNDGQVNSAPVMTTATITGATPQNQAPTANPGGPYSEQVGQAITFNGSGSSDPDGDPLTYSWSFGDGSTGTGVSPTHSYVAAGPYTVSLIVNDGQVNSAPATTTATITEAPVSDGQTLYNTSCAGCHGDFDNPPLPLDSGGPGRKALGARVCSIEGAIEGTAVFPNGVPAMQSLKGLLSHEQIQAMSDFLNSRPVTGQQRYETTCAGCHGLDAQGGRVDEEVLGEDAKDIRKAIRKEREMRFLRCLPGSDIRDIGSFLKNLEDDEDDDDDARGPRHGRGPRDGDDDDDDGDDD